MHSGKQESLKLNIICLMVIGIFTQGYCVTIAPKLENLSIENGKTDNEGFQGNNQTSQVNTSITSSPITQHVQEQQTSDTFLPPFYQPAYLSPFTRPQFKQQLLPLIGENIKQKVKEFVEDVDDGLEFLSNIFSVKEKFAKQTLQKVKQNVPFIGNFKPVASSYTPGPGYNNYFPNMQPTVHTTIKIFTKKPYYRYASDGTITELCSKFNCSKVNQIGEDHAYVKELGLEKYKDFEKNVLRNLEEVEEKKVEATIDSLLPNSALLRHGVKKAKPYSPTHTSIIASSDKALENHLEISQPQVKKVKKIVKKTKPTKTTYSPISGPLLFNNDYNKKSESSFKSFGDEDEKKKNFLYKHEQYFSESRDQLKATNLKIKSKKKTDTTPKPLTKDISKEHKRFQTFNRNQAQQESKITNTFVLPKTRPSTTKASVSKPINSVSKSSFIDKVRQTGNRGSVKFNPKNLNF